MRQSAVGCGALTTALQAFCHLRQTLQAAGLSQHHYRLPVAYARVYRLLGSHHCITGFLTLAPEPTGYGALTTALQAS